MVLSSGCWQDRCLNDNLNWVPFVVIGCIVFGTMFIRIRRDKQRKKNRD